MGGTISAESLPAWVFPPPDGFTADDLFTLPDLPPHTELIDGSLVFVGPQRDFHGRVLYLLVGGLRQTLPETLRVRREMAVRLSRQSVAEPDVSVVRAEAVEGRRQTSYAASDVLLVVEVVSPESEERDRDTKPRKYAKAGIEHFWRVEMKGEDDHPVVYVYELDETTEAYALTGIHHDRVKLTVPFGIDIDLGDIEHL